MLNIPNSPSVAVLIDSDNIQLNLLNHALKFANTYGITKICRAYGDWGKSPLSVSYDAVRELGVDMIQVDRIAKDTTDKQLMIEAVEILCESQIDIFIVVSGDGDFRQLCKRINQKGRKIIGIGNEGNTSSHLKDVCDSFYYIEDLSKEPIQIDPTRLQEFEVLLFQALAKLAGDPQQNIYLGQLGNTLRDIDPSFESRFGDHKLSDWLRKFEEHISVDNHKIKIANSDFTQRIVLLIKVYQQACSTDGLSHIGQMSKLLRQMNNEFATDFSGRTPSKWLDMYPHVFNRQGNYVRLASTNV